MVSAQTRKLVLGILAGVEAWREESAVGEAIFLGGLMDGISLQHRSPGDGKTEDELYYLTLTTIAGNDIQVAAPVKIHHSWEM